MIGRGREVTSVRDVLGRRGACSLIGPGGVGKSTLVAALVASLGDRALLVDARTADRPETVVTRAAEILDVDHLVDVRHGDVTRACAVLAERLSAAGTELLVIDHADRHSEAVFDLFIRVAERTSDVGILVASRNHPVRTLGEVVRLRPFAVGRGTPPEAPAVELFRDTFERAGGAAGALAADPDAFERIVAATGGLPLAIVVVASRAAVIGLQGCLVSLEQSGTAAGGGADTDPVAAALEQSLQDLDATSWDVFEAVGTFRADAPLQHIAAICDVGPGEAASAVERLARRSVVDVTGERVGMLPPVRQLAHRHADARGRRPLLEQRHSHWARTVSKAEPPLGTTEVLTLADDLVGAVAVLLRDGRLEAAVAIAGVVDDAFRADLRHGRRLALLEPVLDACRAATIEGAATGEVVEATIETLRLTAMARADAVGATAARPLLEEAVALVGRSRHRDRQVARLESLRAGLAFESGDLAAARRAAMASIDAGRASGDDLAHYKSIKLLADVELEGGDLDRAASLAQEVTRDAPASLPWLTAYALATVAACHLERGATAATIAAARTIARAAVEAGDVDLIIEADWLTAMADPRRPPLASHDLTGERRGNSIIHVQADIARAIRQLAAGDASAAITIAADCEVRAGALPMLPLTIDAQLLVGVASLELGEPAEAGRAFRQALVDAVTHGSRLRVPDALDGLAAVTVITSGQTRHHDACRAAASTIRTHLGAAARPKPWRPDGAFPSCRPPGGWVDGGTLTQAGLRGALQPSAMPAPDPAAASGGLRALSPAERVVADLVADGCTNREIADRLYVSRRTVESHIAHSFQKLDVTSRTQVAAVVLASRR